MSTAITNTYGAGYTAPADSAPGWAEGTGFDVDPGTQGLGDEAAIKADTLDIAQDYVNADVANRERLVRAILGDVVTTMTAQELNAIEQLVKDALNEALATGAQSPQIKLVDHSDIDPADLPVGVDDSYLPTGVEGAFITPEEAGTDGGVIFLSKELLADPERLGEVALEELGEALAVHVAADGILGDYDLEVADGDVGARISSTIQEERIEDETWDDSAADTTVVAWQGHAKDAKAAGDGNVVIGWKGLAAADSDQVGDEGVTLVTDYLWETAQSVGTGTEVWAADLHAALLTLPTTPDSSFAPVALEDVQEMALLIHPENDQATFSESELRALIDYGGIRFETDADGLVQNVSIDLTSVPATGTSEGEGTVEVPIHDVESLAVEWDVTVARATEIVAEVDATLYGPPFALEDYAVVTGWAELVDHYGVTTPGQLTAYELGHAIADSMATTVLAPSTDDAIEEGDRIVNTVDIVALAMDPPERPEPENETDPDDPGLIAEGKSAWGIPANAEVLHSTELHPHQNHVGHHIFRVTYKLPDDPDTTFVVALDAAQEGAPVLHATVVDELTGDSIMYGKDGGALASWNANDLNVEFTDVAPPTGEAELEALNTWAETEGVTVLEGVATSMTSLIVYEDADGAMKIAYHNITQEADGTETIGDRVIVDYDSQAGDAQMNAAMHAWEGDQAFAAGGGGRSMASWDEIAMAAGFTILAGAAAVALAPLIMGAAFTATVTYAAVGAAAVGATMVIGANAHKMHASHQRANAQNYNNPDGVDEDALWHTAGSTDTDATKSETAEEAGAPVFDISTVNPDHEAPVAETDEFTIIQGTQDTQESVTDPGLIGTGYSAYGTPAEAEVIADPEFVPAEEGPYGVDTITYHYTLSGAPNVIYSAAVIVNDPDDALYRLVLQGTKTVVTENTDGTVKQSIQVFNSLGDEIDSVVDLDYDTIATPMTTDETLHELVGDYDASVAQIETVLPAGAVMGDISFAGSLTSAEFTLPGEEEAQVMMMKSTYDPETGDIEYSHQYDGILSEAVASFDRAIELVEAAGNYLVDLLGLTSLDALKLADGAIQLLGFLLQNVNPAEVAGAYGYDTLAMTGEQSETVRLTASVTSLIPAVLSTVDPVAVVTGELTSYIYGRAMNYFADSEYDGSLVPMGQEDGGEEIVIDQDAANPNPDAAAPVSPVGDISAATDAVLAMANDDAALTAISDNILTTNMGTQGITEAIKSALEGIALSESTIWVQRGDDLKFVDLTQDTEFTAAMSAFADGIYQKIKLPLGYPEDSSIEASIVEIREFQSTVRAQGNHQDRPHLGPIVMTTPLFDAPPTQYVPKENMDKVVTPFIYSWDVVETAVDADTFVDGPADSFTIFTTPPAARGSNYLYQRNSNMAAEHKYDLDDAGEPILSTGYTGAVHRSPNIPDGETRTILNAHFNFVK